MDRFILFPVTRSISIPSISRTTKKANPPLSLPQPTIGTSILYPYGFAIATTKYTVNDQGVATGTKPGQYLLAIEAPVAAEDKSLGLAVLTYVVNVVSDPADIPSGPSSQEAPTIPTYK